MSENTPLTAAAALTGDAAPVSQAAPTGGTPEAVAEGSQPPQPAPDAQESPSVNLPGKDATPEQWAEFYKQIGAPESPDAYELPVPEGEDGEFAKTAANWFKDAGLLPQQAQALASKWNEFAAAQKQAMEAAEQQRIQAMDTKNRAEEVALKNEWGQKHDANMELARRAARQFLPAEKTADVVTALENVIGYSETIKLLHKIGEGLAEHDAPGLNSEPGSAKKDIATILYGATSSKQ